MANEYWRFLSGTDFLSFFISSHFIYYQGERLEIDEVMAEICKESSSLGVCFLYVVCIGQRQSREEKSQGHGSWDTRIPFWFQKVRHFESIKSRWYLYLFLLSLL